MKFDFKEKLSPAVQMYIKAGIIMLLIIVAVVLVVIFTSGKKEEGSQESTTGSESILKKDSIPEIQVLMEKYFEAKLNCDVEALEQLVKPIAGYTREELEYEVGSMESEAFRKIEAYQNISAYTMPGLLADTYVVWVYYEMKFEGADTPAPSLNKMYVCTDETGVYIYNGSTEGEINSYLDEVSQNAEVVELVNSVNEKLTEAVGQDENLKGIFDKLINTEEETEPEAESGETT